MSPAFGETIDTDLADTGFSLLRASLALREIRRQVPEIWRRGFAPRPGNAFEALCKNGSPEDTDRGFFRVIGAASYHLAGYSALAFSLIAQRPAAANLAPAEEALVSLIMRDLTQLGVRARTRLLDAAHSDRTIAQAARQMAEKSIRMTW